jgi:hypothetical protein
MQIEKLIDRHFTCVISKEEADQYNLREGNQLNQVQMMRFLSQKPLIQQQTIQWDVGASIGCTEFNDGVAVVAIIFIEHDPEIIQRDIQELLTAQERDDRNISDFYEIHIMTDEVILDSPKREQEEIIPVHPEIENGIFGSDILEKVKWLCEDGASIVEPDAPEECKYSTTPSEDDLRKLLREARKPYSHHSAWMQYGEYTAIVSWKASKTNSKCVWLLNQAEARGACVDVYLKNHVCYVVVHGEMDRVQMEAMDQIVLESSLKTEPYAMRAYLEEHYAPLAPEVVQMFMDA